MRVVRNAEISKTAEIRIPPGAYVSRFYHDGKLSLTRSGIDVHVTGARLIQLVALVVEPSEKVEGQDTDIVLSWLKNDVEFKRLVIPPERIDPVVIDLRSVESEGAGDSISMDFEAITDRLHVEIVATGQNASTLTALGIFNR